MFIIETLDYGKGNKEINAYNVADTAEWAGMIDSVKELSDLNNEMFRAGDEDPSLLMAKAALNAAADPKRREYSVVGTGCVVTWEVVG